MVRDERQEIREREQVLSDYGTWRLAADPDAPVVDEVRTLETLLRLKAERLDSPEVGLWTEDLARELVTEVVPRTVVQLREQVMDMVPALRRFFHYLHESGRWDEDGMPAESAPSMLHDLEFAALEAADDPTRRSYSTNILGHGLALGVDLEDEDALADYMHWVNSLPDGERIALSDTGRLPAPSTPFDPASARAQREVEAAEDQDPAWPWFLPPLEDDGAPLGELTGPQDVRPYAQCALVERAGIVLDFVGDGRRATATGALGREDTAALCSLLDLEPGARSLWDRPELAGVWVTLLDGGWLELLGSTVRAATGPVPAVSREADPEDFVEFGHAVITAALLGREARDPEDGGFRGMPDTAAALLVACGQGGLEFPPRRDGPGTSIAVPHDPLTGDPDGAAMGRMFRVLHDLEDLQHCGLLEEANGVYRGSSAVTLALVGLLRRDG